MFLNKRDYIAVTKGLLAGNILKRDKEVDKNKYFLVGKDGQPKNGNECELVLSREDKTFKSATLGEGSYMNVGGTLSFFKDKEIVMSGRFFTTLYRAQVFSGLVSEFKAAFRGKGI